MKKGNFPIDADVWNNYQIEGAKCSDILQSATGMITQQEGNLFLTVWDDDTDEIICEMKISDILFALHDFIERDL